MTSIDGVPFFRANLGNYSCLSIIKKMKIPYLLIRGEQDKEINRNLKSTLEAIGINSRAKVTELSRAGHMANLDRPNQFNRIIAAFWDQIENDI